MNASLRFYTSAVIVSSVDDGIIQQHMTPPLHAVTNPEEKRKIIGDTFIKVANEAMLELNLQAEHVFLAQGVHSQDLYIYFVGQLYVIAFLLVCIPLP